MLWLAAFFAVGIVCAKFANAGMTTLVAACAAGVAAALIAMPRRTAVLGLFAAFAALGGVCFQLENMAVAPDRVRALYDNGEIVSGDPVEAAGTLLALPEPSYDGVFLRMAVDELVHRGEQVSASGEVRIFVPVDSREGADDLRTLELDSGTRVRVDCELRREEQFQNPGVRSRIASLDEQGIDAVANLKSPLLIEVVGRSQGFSPAALVYNMRLRLIDESRARFDGKTAGVLIASLLGNKYFLDKGTADLFREGGTFHILVISGLHITFIGGLVLLVVGWFTGNRMAQFAITSAFLWAYALAVGAELPVVRASTVFTILLFSRVIYRDGNLLNSLGACAIVLLALHPSSLLTPSFQLTFLSVGAIVGIAFPLVAGLRKAGAWFPSTSEPLPPAVPEPLKRFCETLYWRNAVWEHEVRRQVWSGNLYKRPYVTFGERVWVQKLSSYLFEGLLVSLIVQICLLPLSIYYFHRISLAGTFLNLWVGLVLAIETFTALAAVAVGQLSSTLSLPLAAVSQALNSLLIIFPKLAVGTGWASVRVPIYSGAGSAAYLLYFVPIAFVAAAVYWFDIFRLTTLRASELRQVGAAAATLTAVAALVVFHPFSSPRADGRLRVDFLDVGQGDAAIVTFPDGTTLLVDGGGRGEFRKESGDEEYEVPFEPDVPRIGEMVVSEFLWEKGYSSVDTIVATHADSDHMQGLSDVASNFRVGKALFGRIDDGDVDFDNLDAVLRRNGVPVQLVSAGDRFDIAGARVEVLNPTLVNAFSVNNNSVVLRITFGERSFLLTGDIERDAENMLAGVPLRADVLKVPHHGSRTSSSERFVEAVDAGFAVVSVGKRSRFGHPHAEVVARWRDHGANVLTTGMNGTITFVSDGIDLTVESFLR